MASSSSSSSSGSLLQQVVSGLNAPPFSLGLSLVAFDEKSPVDVLQLTSTVLGELDRAHAVDVRAEPRDATAARVVDFLRVLNYPGVAAPADADAVAAGVARADKGTLYAVLGWALGRLPALKRRAYVARYLVRLDVPPEFALDEGVAALLDEYAALQADFKDAHRALDRAVAGSGAKATPGELKKEIATLDDERRQLVDRIAGLKRRTADAPGFAPLLAATSALRREQEAEAKAAERLAEQRAAAAAAERRYADVNRRLAEARAATREDVTGEELVAGARREAADAAALAEKVLPASLEARRATLGRLQAALAEPPVPEAQLYARRAEADALERAVEALTREVAGLQRAGGDEKLAMYRQQAALVARNVAAKEEALEAETREGEALAREAEAKEARLSALAGPRFMRKAEFKAYAAALRAKTATFKALKAELTDLRGESVVLARTEAVLRARAGDRDAFLARQEEKRGVAGYTAVVADLEKVSSLKSRIDEAKSATLGEIARIVDDINAAIGERKARLAPAIARLRAVRAEFAELDARHLRERATYESVAVGLAAEAAASERAAADALAEAAAEEGRVALLRERAAAAAALAARARAEARYEAGDGRFSDAARTLKEAAAARVAALDAAAKDGRRRQKELKENAGAYAAQRAAFASLAALLRAKLKAAGAGAGGAGSPAGGDDGGGAGGAGGGAGGGGRGGGSPGGRAVEYAVGGARVMRLPR